MNSKVFSTLLAIFISCLAVAGCSKTIRVHPSHYAASYPGGKLDKKIVVVIPNSEKYKKYTYNAWWAGWSADIELGEALEEVSMQTVSSLYKDVYLVREKPNNPDVHLIFTPTVSHYRHDVPALFGGVVPHEAT